MKDTVVIKVYRNDISCSDYHDIYLNDFDAKVKELKSFAEITYSGTLSEQEKDKYISIIQFFAQDAEIKRGTLEIYDLPLSIIFTKAQIETF